MVSCAGFLTGVLQKHARHYNLPIDHLSFSFSVLSHYRDEAVIVEAMAKLAFGEQLEMDDEVKSPDDGILVHGLSMDGFR